MPDALVLEVLLHGTRAGTLTAIGGERTLFSFDEAYLGDARRPTLGLGLRDARGEPIVDFAPTRRRLLPFFANMLPEGALRDYLAERAGVNSERELQLLAALGRDLPGAVEIRPVGGVLPTDAAGGGRAGAPAESGRGLLRFSLAGVQLKFSALVDTGKRGGLVIPAEGVGGAWIVKLPSPRFAGVPENEFSMMALARAVGVTVPETRLVALDAVEGLPRDLGDLRGPALAVRRFDRTPEGPVHMEDFAQVFGVYPERKYERGSLRTIARVLAVESGVDDVVELVRRLVFCILVGNADMHLKNWSVIYPDRRTPRLSPAYDLVSTISYIADDALALKVARTRRFAEVGRAEIASLAEKAGVPGRPVLAAAEETVSRFHEAWARGRRDLPMEPRVAAAIEAHLARLPLARGL